MSINIVKLKEGITATNTAGDVVTFELEYDKFWNEYFLKPTSFVDKDGNKKTFSANINVFQKDQWNDSGLAAFNIDEDGKNLLHEELVKTVAGVTKQYKAPVPKWAQSKNNATGDADAATTDNNPPTAAESDQSKSTDPLGDLLESFGQSTGLSDLLNDLKDIKDVTGTLKKVGANKNYASGSTLEKGQTLVYPLALEDSGLSKEMDTVVIRQFNYVAPNQEEFIDTKYNVFTQGLIGSDPKYRQEENLGMVILPMPQSFGEKRSVNFGEDTMNTLSAGMTQSVVRDMESFLLGGAFGGAAGFASKFLPGASGGNSSFGLGGIGGAARTGIAAVGLAKAIDGVRGSDSGKQLLGSVVSSNILKAAGVNVSAETILARGAGIVPNPNMELLFRSPVLRNFALVYRMTARSKAEGERIRRIIRFFKQGMSPRNSKTGENYFLKTPNVFGIKFKTSGDEDNKSLPKFKTCALYGFETDYTPDKIWAAYDKGQPVSVTIIMEFKELTPIYSGDFDDYKNLDDIGY